ncbi:hypothetical protein [Parafilimonas sp.]|uniref:hypothetical protein n=1 Tax=Parafilimonas sp. TaxID=1969739 RepID=UPI0039E33C1E
MKKLFIVISLAVSALIFNSCSSSHYVSEQPAVPVYARPESPGPAYVWVDGGWRWHGGRYVYTNGYWARPRQNHVWVNGTWVKTSHGYYWQRGHWRK